MAAYIIFTRYRIRDAAEMETYGKKARNAPPGPDAKIRSIYGPCETLEGPPADGVVMIEFPTMEAARDWYNSPGYTEARRHRQLGADYTVLITQGP